MCSFKVEKYGELCTQFCHCTKQKEYYFFMGILKFIYLFIANLLGHFLEYGLAWSVTGIQFDNHNLVSIIGTMQHNKKVNS